MRITKCVLAIPSFFCGRLLRRPFSIIGFMRGFTLARFKIADILFKQKNRYPTVKDSRLVPSEINNYQAAIVKQILFRPNCKHDIPAIIHIYIVHLYFPPTEQRYIRTFKFLSAAKC
mmetsp:Transcript_10873/g.16376  ORF Transcript_10873/g.16376 Transcript_10873/m.16376 type:complete len:117 (-) Transcript_10873:1575-1925(-)